MIDSVELEYKDQIILPNGADYCGQMLNDKRCGKGRSICNDGMYEGY